MNLLADIPYSSLKENKRSYEILLRRDFCDNTYTDIAKAFGLSVAVIISHYHRIKIRQMRHYINHLAIVNGHEHTAAFRKIYSAANDCYQDLRYVTAYLEKEYGEVLSEYRAGEPGINEQFIKSLPPFKTKWSQQTISRVVEMREVDRKTFVEIGKKLEATKFKVEHLYEWYYHEKVLAFLDIIEKKTGKKVWDHYFKSYRKAKNRYEMIVQDYPELFDNINAYQHIAPYTPSLPPNL